MLNKSIKKHSNRNRKLWYVIPSFVPFKSEILAEIRRVKYRDLKDMVYGMELTYNESVDKLD